MVGCLTSVDRQLLECRLSEKGGDMAKGQLVDAIRAHYDRLAFFYRTFWGEHIHHGYWEADETSVGAQIQLITRLAERAAVPSGARVLDVGCGFGGSSRWLARHRDCQVTGITISPVQVKRATKRARAEGLADRARFLIHDANHLDFPAASFDVVWIIECSEHLEDKERFIDACARILKPGGRIALCAWLDADTGRREDAQLVEEVCRGMLCPSLASAANYTACMQKAGFEDVVFEDITRRVEKTWDLCLAVVERRSMRALRWLMDEKTKAFVLSFKAIRRAFAEGAMSYGMFTARRAGGATNNDHA
jgi:tocopherol O-methyltransferase